MRKILFLPVLFLLYSSLYTLTLKDCILLAEKNNKTLQKAKEEVKRYRQSYNEVKGHLLPQLNLNGGYQYKYEKLPEDLVPEIPPLSLMLTPMATNDDHIVAGYIDEAFSNLIPEKTKKTYNLMGKVQLNQVVFMGGKLINGINIAKKLYHLQEKRYFLTKQDIIFKTIDMFYKCILANQVVQIQKEALDTANKHLEQVKLMYQKGLVSEYDFLRAKLEVKKIKPQLLEAEKNRGLAKEAFAKFLNLPKEDFVLEGEIRMPSIKRISLDEALEIGMKNRMELKLAKIGLQVHKVQLRYQKGNFLPDIGINAEYGYYGTTEKSFKKDNFGNYYQVGIGFSMPLFTGFSNRAKIAKARCELNQSFLDYENLKDMIELDIKNSYKQLYKDIETAEVQKDNVNLSKKALEIAKKRYENQLSDQLEIFDAQLQKKGSELSYLNVVYKVIIDYEKFKKSIGENLFGEVKNEK